MEGNRDGDRRVTAAHTPTLSNGTDPQPTRPGQGEARIRSPCCLLNLLEDSTGLPSGIQGEGRRHWGQWYQSFARDFLKCASRAFGSRTTLTSSSLKTGNMAQGPSARNVTSLGPAFAAAPALGGLHVAEKLESHASFDPFRLWRSPFQESSSGSSTIFSSRGGVGNTSGCNDRGNGDPSTLTVRRLFIRPPNPSPALRGGPSFAPHRPP
ncbi:hypothetical protein Hsar01_02481 [Haloferula sargassicola]|uniref:Uncharacterized protein n=1 Tax=Haloferula sargassicola TaxID=490096 RepID=A0ABP9UP96_9BACT